MTEIINLNTDKKISQENNKDLTSPSRMVVSNEDWQTVKQRKKKRALSTIIGKNENCGSLKAVPKYTHLHVFRLSPDTTPDNLRNLLNGKFPEVLVEKMASKHPVQYSSYKVSVFDNNYQEVTNPEMWPTGVCINRFLYLRPRNTNDKLKLPYTKKD